MPSRVTTEIHMSLHLAELELRFHKLRGIPTGTLKMAKCKRNWVHETLTTIQLLPPAPHLVMSLLGSWRVPARQGWE